MTDSDKQPRRPKYLKKKDILAYYYNTYIGLAILLLLVIAIKFEMISLVLCLALSIMVIIRILYGVKKLAHTISCPFCGDGELKRKWGVNAYYLATLPLEKKMFECPNCGKEIEVVDHEE